MLTTKENIPKVTRLNGSARILSMGLIRTSKRVRTIPPNKKVGSPSDTFTPGRIWEIKNNVNALNNTFLKKDFIIKV